MSDILAITPDEITTFYYCLGRALWAIGALEHYLAHYLVIIGRGTFDSMEAAQKELDRAFSFTLGNLLREFRKYCELSSDVDHRLSVFKAERDWLCHEIYHRNHTDLLNRPRFEKLLDRLTAFKTEGSSLHNILDESFDAWCRANDISAEELQEGIDTTIQGWQGDEVGQGR